jgi:cell division protein FtsQ
MAVAGKKRNPPPTPAELEKEEAARAEAEEAATTRAEEAAEESEAPVEKSRRKPKARTPQKSASPLSRFRRKSSGGSAERRPMQRSLLPAMAPGTMTQNAAKIGGGALLFIMLLVGLFFGYYLFAGSRFFFLRGVDVEGNTLLSDTEVASMVQSGVSKGVLNADLKQIQKNLETYPLIRSAQVVRLLPDRLRVVLVERTPVAVVRLANESNACVDEDGAIFGDLNTWRAPIMPPVIRGMAESGERMQEINKQWIQLYRQLLEELDQTEPRLSSRVSEVIFDAGQGVRLVLENKGIIVLLGREDFRKRLNAALDVIDAVERKDVQSINVLRLADADRLLSGVPIKYLNVTDPNRVIVGLDE